MPRTALLVLLILLLPAAAVADHEPPSPDSAPAHLWGTGIVAQYNNLFGAVFVSYRHRHTYNPSAERGLTSNLYRERGVAAVTSVFNNQLHAWYEWSPLAILRLRATYKTSFLPGLDSTLGAGLPFDDADDDFSPDVLRARSGENVRAFVQELVVEPNVQVRLGRLIVLNNLAWSLRYVEARGGAFLYDNLTDSLSATRRPDLTLQEQLLVLGDLDSGRGAHRLYAGATWQYNRAFAARVQRHRVGGMLLYSPSYWRRTLYEPTFILFAGANVADRHRGGEPYAFLLFRTGLRRHGAL